MASVSKIISYLLCTILILKAKQAGRIASTMQFIFWFLLAICQGFTFGSIVNHDLIGLTWTSAQKIIAVISWVLIVLNFIVYCFADKAPEYIDLKGNPKSYFYLPLPILIDVFLLIAIYISIYVCSIFSGGLVFMRIGYIYYLVYTRYILS